MRCTCALDEKMPMAGGRAEIENGCTASTHGASRLRSLLLKDGGAR